MNSPNQANGADPKKVAEIAGALAAAGFNPSQVADGLVGNKAFPKLTASELVAALKAAFPKIDNKTLTAALTSTKRFSSTEIQRAVDPSHGVDPSPTPFTFKPPAGKACLWAMAVGAHFEQFFELKNEAGKIVAKGQGAGAPIHYISHGQFTADGGSYTVEVTTKTDEGQVLQEHLISAQAELSFEGLLKAQMMTIGGEDWKDDDYNDTFLTITWFEHDG